MSKTASMRRATAVSSLLIVLAVTFAAYAAPPGAPPGGARPAKGELPPFDKVKEGFDKVVSTIDGSKPLYELYRESKTDRLLAVLPSGYENQLVMIACTVSGGDPHAGVMGPTHYVKWRKIRNQLVLIEPNLFVRTEGDKEAKASIEQLYTGRVIVAVPILSWLRAGDP